MEAIAFVFCICTGLAQWGPGPRLGLLRATTIQNSYRQNSQQFLCQEFTNKSPKLPASLQETGPEKNNEWCLKPYNATMLRFRLQDRFWVQCKSKNKASDEKHKSMYPSGDKYLSHQVFHTWMKQEISDFWSQVWRQSYSPRHNGKMFLFLICI